MLAASVVLHCVKESMSDVLRNHIPVTCVVHADKRAEYAAALIDCCLQSDYGIGQARTASQTGTQSGASTTSNLYTGL